MFIYMARPPLERQQVLAPIKQIRGAFGEWLGLASRESREAILRAYPYLESADVDEVLRYAACLAEDETIELAR